MDDFTDFYGIGQLLNDTGRDAVRRTREFMTKEVEPVINRYWTREEFPFELAEGIAALGIADDELHERMLRVTVGVFAVLVADAGPDPAPIERAAAPATTRPRIVVLMLSPH